MNGRAVLGLTNLKIGGFQSNVCVTENFSNLNREKVAILAEVLDESCAFIEANNDVAFVTPNISLVNTDSNNCGDQIKSAIEVNAKLASELNNIRDELKTVRASEDQAKKETDYIINLYKKFDVLRNETFARKNQEWQKFIDIKMSENKKLAFDLEKMTVGLSQKDAVIEMLKKKISGE